MIKKATTRPNGTVVACRIVKKSTLAMLGDKQTLPRFSGELKIQSQLEHGHICQSFQVSISPLSNIILILMLCVQARCWISLTRQKRYL